MTVRPLKDRVVLKFDPPTYKGLVTPVGGIDHLYNLQPDQLPFEVVAIGPKVRDVAVGDRVALHRHYDGTYVTSNLVLVEEKEIRLKAQ